MAERFYRISKTLCEDCPACEGTGQVDDANSKTLMYNISCSIMSLGKKCNVCKGKGWVAIQELQNYREELDLEDEDEDEEDEDDD